MAKFLNAGAPIGAAADGLDAKPVFLRDVMPKGDDRRSVFVNVAEMAVADGCGFYQSTFLIEAVKKGEPIIFFDSKKFYYTMLQYYLDERNYEYNATLHLDCEVECPSVIDFFDPSMFIWHLADSHFSAEAIARIMRRMSRQLVGFYAKRNGLDAEERNRIEDNVCAYWSSLVKSYRGQPLPQSCEASDIEDTCKDVLKCWRLQQYPQGTRIMDDFKRLLEKRTATIIALPDSSEVTGPTFGLIFAGLCSALIEAYKEPDPPKWATHIIVNDMEALGYVEDFASFIQEFDALHLPCAVVRNAPSRSLGVMPPLGFTPAQFNQFKNTFVAELSAGENENQIQVAYGNPRAATTLCVYTHPEFCNLLDYAAIGNSSWDFNYRSSGEAGSNEAISAHLDTTDELMYYNTAFGIVPEGQAHNGYSYLYGSNFSGTVTIHGKKTVREDGTECISFDPMTVTAAFKINRRCKMRPSHAHDNNRIKQYWEQLGLRVRVVLTNARGEVIQQVPGFTSIDLNDKGISDVWWQKGDVRFINSSILPITIIFTEDDYYLAKKLNDDPDDALLISIQTAPLHDGEFQTAATKVLHLAV